MNGRKARAARRQLEASAVHERVESDWDEWAERMTPGSHFLSRALDWASSHPAVGDLLTLLVVAVALGATLLLLSYELGV